MIRVEASRVIERPIDDVWAYISNLDNMLSWDPGLLALEWQRPLRMGTRVELRDASTVLRLVSRVVPPVFTVNDYEEGHRFALRLSRGTSSMETVYSLEALAATRSKVTRTFKFEGHGIWSLLELASRRRATREREAEVSNLKRILEASPQSGP